MACGTDTITHGPFDSSYVRAWEEVPDVRNLAALLDRIVRPGEDLSTLTIQDRICIPGRFDYLYL